MTRNEARETLMQILYEMDAAKLMTDEAAVSKGTQLAQDRLPASHAERCGALLEQILQHVDEIDEEINTFSTKWKTSRMPKVDLAIMRLAIGEMKYSNDVPDAVVINEAIIIAKKYSTEHSAKFIHGVLGTASKTYSGD